MPIIILRNKLGQICNVQIIFPQNLVLLLHLKHWFSIPFHMRYNFDNTLHLGYFQPLEKKKEFWKKICGQKIKILQFFYLSNLKFHILDMFYLVFRKPVVKFENNPVNKFWKKLWNYLNIVKNLEFNSVLTQHTSNVALW